MHHCTKSFFIHTILMLLPLTLHTAQAGQVNNNDLAYYRFRNAIRSGNLEIAQKALDDGADINAKDQDGSTMLMFILCLFEGNDASDARQDWLVAHGACPFIRDTEDGGSWNSYNYARVYPNRFQLLLEHPQHTKTVIATLCETFAEHTPIYMKELVSIVQEYAQYGPTTEDLNSALLYAIQNRDKKRVQFFLDYGADCNARYANERTPLMHAVMLSKLSQPIIDLLFEYGANALLQDSNGDTALRHIQNHLSTSQLAHDISDQLKACTTDANQEQDSKEDRA